MQQGRITINDLEELKNLQPPDWDDITVPHQWYVGSPNCSPFKWTINDNICGIGTIIYHEDTAWLAHIIVHADHRNKGLGRIITQGLVDRVDRSKYQTIYLIATDLGYPVYQKVGFELEGIYSHFSTNDKLVTQLPNSILPYSEEYLEEVLMLDRQVSGEGRQHKLQLHLEDAVVFKSDDKIEGAFLPNLLNGLIIANNPEAGVELMKLRLQTVNYAICPAENEIATAFLLQHNFEQVRISRRMRIGAAREWQPAGLYNRISGQLG
ncbi:MAG: GNAT family N-acetyltransferase [Bacteroidota bacterium]